VLHTIKFTAAPLCAAAAVFVFTAATAQPPPSAPHPPPPPAQSAPPPPSPPDEVKSINGAGPHPLPPPDQPADKTAPPDPTLLKAETLLDRARFSPGVIDGHAGTNFRHALLAYQSANHLPASGDLDPKTWAALVRDGKPVAALYTITPQDEAGPFAPDVGEDFVKLAALPQGPLYHDTAEMLAERFHMDEDAMKALNPGVDFAKAGSVLVVAQPGAAPFEKRDVTRIEVSKAHAQVIAYGDKHQVLAVYPATVGSRERPSPSGTHKVNGVAWNTDYTYDPKKLKWGPRKHGKLHIKPGPNGPVGVVWIALNAPDYGIHGTPDPSKIGKTASHGCVRLTNWDAVALAHGVKPGVVVQFVGARGG
jgi:lipoprotein-anchoring transpeptidase ErfK/SrfK